MGINGSAGDAPEPPPSAASKVSARPHENRLPRSAARIPKRAGGFNGAPVWRGKLSAPWSLPAPRRTGIDVRAAVPAGEHAVLVPAHVGHRVGKPERRADQPQDDQK